MQIENDMPNPAPLYLSLAEDLTDIRSVAQLYAFNIYDAVFLSILSLEKFPVADMTFTGH